MAIQRGYGLLLRFSPSSFTRITALRAKFGKFKDMPEYPYVSLLPGLSKSIPRDAIIDAVSKITSRRQPFKVATEPLSILTYKFRRGTAKEIITGYKLMFQLPTEPIESLRSELMAELGTVIQKASPKPYNMGKTPFILVQHFATEGEALDQLKELEKLGQNESVELVAEALSARQYGKEKEKELNLIPEVPFSGSN